jgi:cytochrome P450
MKTYARTPLPLSTPAVTPARPYPVRTASFVDTFKVVMGVILPNVMRGIIIRRPGMERLAQRFDTDGRAVRLLQRLRRKYGSTPLYLGLPWRPHVLLLNASDVDAVLARSPVPYATATREKRAALGHFEPGNILISDAPQRVKLRPYHEEALATREKVHPLAASFERIIREELTVILDCQKQGLFGRLDWAGFSLAWSRITRRVTLGDQARDDQALTAKLNRLRAKANWAYFLPANETRIRDFQAHLREYVDGAAGECLVSRLPRSADVEPASQVAQWLFAFDAAGMATFRALALLATHPDLLRGVREEALKEGGSHDLARDCFMESLRLWPTTPAILRELAQPGALGDGIEIGTGILIFTPFFHRDSETLGFANRIETTIWRGGDALPGKGLVPFSAGPAMCPAHNLVPLLGATTLKAIASRMAVRLVSPKLDPECLPGSLSPFGLRFEMNHLPIGNGHPA